MHDLTRRLPEAPVGSAPPKTVEPPKPSADTNEEGKIRANLERLPKEDRSLAEAQQYCPETGERLGDPEMGVPVKVMVKGQAVFVCCKNCQGAVVDGGEETLDRSGTRTILDTTLPRS